MAQKTNTIAEWLGLDELWEQLEGCEFQATRIQDLFPALGRMLGRLAKDFEESSGTR